MQKPQLLGKYLAGSKYSPKTTSWVINNLSDYLVKSKYGKVLQTALYNKIRLFLSSKGGRGFDPQNPPLPGCATGLPGLETFVNWAIEQLLKVKRRTALCLLNNTHAGFVISYVSNLSDS